MTKPVAVSFRHCADYSPESLQTALEAVLEPLGGMRAFVRPGQSVMLKPNLLTSRTPEQAVTTHPGVVRALIRAVRQCGGLPLVADSPANVVKLESVWESTGYGAMCAEEGVPLLNLEKAGSVPFEVNGIRFSVAKPIVEADVLITVPKIKTHVLTIFTGAVKNLYGTIPGFQKTSLHEAYPTPREFGRVVAALYAKVRPALAVADGIIGLHGDGPSAGDPIPLEFLAASPDSAALDAAVCSVLGIETRAVPYFAPIAAAGLGETDSRRISLLGDPPGPELRRAFRVPGTLAGRLIPGWLVRSLKPLLWIRPQIHDDCVMCGRCVKACPAGALHMQGRTAPILSPRLCIECCCCHEVCPAKAISMRQSPLLNLVRRGRLP